VVAFAFGDDTTIEVLLNAVHLLLCLFKHRHFFFWDTKVSHTKRQPCKGRVLETDVLHRVEQVDRRSASTILVSIVNHACTTLLTNRTVIKRHALSEDLREQHASNCRDQSTMLR